MADLLQGHHRKHLVVVRSRGDAVGGAASECVQGALVTALGIHDHDGRTLAPLLLQDPIGFGGKGPVDHHQIGGLGVATGLARGRIVDAQDARAGSQALEGLRGVERGAPFGQSVGGRLRHHDAHPPIATGNAIALGAYPTGALARVTRSNHEPLPRGGEPNLPDRSTRFTSKTALERSTGGESG